MEQKQDHNDTMLNRRPWYAWRPNGGNIWPPSQGDELREAILVPRNDNTFRRFRDSAGITAIMGMMMAIVLCSFPATFVYISMGDPSPTSPALKIFAFLLSVCAVGIALFLGSGVLPAFQQSKAVTQVVKQNLPALIVNRAGIWDYSSSHIFGFVPWDEIDAVMLDYRYSPKVNKYWPGIAFVVKNKEVLLCRKSVLVRFWLNQESGIAGRRQIFIPQEWLDMPIQEVLKQIEGIRPKVRS